jgi:hypothetical protein
MPQFRDRTILHHSELAWLSAARNMKFIGLLSIISGVKKLSNNLPIVLYNKSC